GSHRPDAAGGLVAARYRGGGSPGDRRGGELIAKRLPSQLAPEVTKGALGRGGGIPTGDEVLDVEVLDGVSPVLRTHLVELYDELAAPQLNDVQALAGGTATLITDLDGVARLELAVLARFLDLVVVEVHGQAHDVVVIDGVQGLRILRAQEAVHAAVVIVEIQIVDQGVLRLDVDVVPDPLIRLVLVAQLQQLFDLLIRRTLPGDVIAAPAAEEAHGGEDQQHHHGRSDRGDEDGHLGGAAEFLLGL